MLRITIAITALAATGWVIDLAANAGWLATLLIIGLSAVACAAVIHTHRADQADTKARNDRRYASQHPVNRGPR